MKSLILLTEREDMKLMYEEEVKLLFSDKLDISTYSLENDFNYISDDRTMNKADIVLISDINLFTIIKKMLKKESKIIYLNFNFIRDKIEILKSFPENTKALVCFNFYEISQQTISILYESGITNINFAAFNPAYENTYKEFKLAVVGEFSSIVPDNIKNIVSIGKRKLAFSTVMALALSADILDEQMEERINYYCKDHASSDNAILSVFDNSVYSKLQIKTIMNCIEYGVLIYDSNMKILSYNNNITKLFCLTQDITSRHITDIKEFLCLKEILYNKNNVNNILIEIYKERSVVVSKQNIEGSHNGFILVVKDITDIIALENSLRSKLRKKGHIAKYSFDNIYGNSEDIKECIKRAKIVSKIDGYTLIVGESGSGKELFAQAIHNESSRRNYPFIGINCASLPLTLLESELFGYEEGSFTGAKKGGKTGLFEMAHRGTLFLDEIGEINLETQAKLLRVLEEKEIMKLGSGQIVSVDVRIIAATNRNLRQLVKDGKFRLDLYYRLNNLVVNVPPLRKRRKDIIPLTEIFIRDAGFKNIIIDSEVRKFLTEFQWKGNVRELKNCVEYMANISTGHIKMEHLPEYILEEAAEEECDDLLDTNLLNLLNFKDKKYVYIILNELLYKECGRKVLQSRINRNEEYISEYKLRNILKILNDREIIYFKKGREGIKVTEKGKKLYKVLAYK